MIFKRVIVKNLAKVNLLLFILTFVYDKVQDFCFLVFQFLRFHFLIYCIGFKMSLFHFVRFLLFLVLFFICLIFVFLGGSFLIHSKYMQVTISPKMPHINLPFKVGHTVEVRSFENGFRGAWFLCKVLRLNFFYHHFNYHLILGQIKYVEWLMKIIRAQISKPSLWMRVVHCILTSRHQRILC